MIWKGQLFDGALDQLSFREKAVPILGRYTKNMQDASLIAKVRIRGNANIACNFVGGNEPDTVNIGGKLIRITRDHCDGLVTIVFVDLHRIGGTSYVEYAVLFSHIPSLDDFLCTACTQINAVC